MLSATGAALVSTPILHRAFAADLPASAVSVAKCQTYNNNDLVAALSTMFDQLGGIDDLVRGKTVGIKINLVGDNVMRVGNAPPELSHWTHPALIGAAVYLFGRAGAQRIRILECCGSTAEPFESYIAAAGWRPNDILSAAPRVEFENTNGLGSGSAYACITCPSNSHIFPAYDVNHSYVDCDVFVSMPKMKEHRWFGVTLSMKNIYGTLPLTIYGDNANIDAPGTPVSGTRVSVMHDGVRAPCLTAPQERDPTSPRDGAYRLPRVIGEIVAARPVDLAIIDGIESMGGGEGPWVEAARRISPGVLVAGRNPANTDAVAMAVMGFDPAAVRGQAPFEESDNFMDFAEEMGVGSRDLSRIEVRGASIQDARFDFRTAGMSLNAVANAASYASRAVSPGEIVALSGLALGPLYLETGKFDHASGLLQTEAFDAQVLFDGRPAPVLYVSASACSAIVPYEVDGENDTQVQVQYRGVQSTPMTIPVAPAVPALFSVDCSGKGQGAILNQDGSLNSAANPAASGEILILYGTGEGQTSPAGIDGKQANDPYPKPLLPPAASIAGLPAEIVYYGAAPTEVAGLFQMNVRIPEAAPSGNQSIQVSFGNFVSQDGLTVAIR